MTMTICWVRIIRACSFKLACIGIAGAALAAAESSPALKEFSLGMNAFAAKDYAGAVSHLKAAQPKLPKLADYIDYYLGAAKAQSNDFEGAVQELAAMSSFTSPLSPLGAKASLLEAQSRLHIGDVPGAVRVLTGSFEALPEPDGAMTLAQAYEARGEKAPAVALYQRVYFEHPATQSAVTAAAAMERLKQTMGEEYPPPGPKQMLERGTQWLAAKEYTRPSRSFRA